jgi:hypothetical protein
MTGVQFDALATLTRAREPVRSAVRRVLVDETSLPDGARRFGMTPSAPGNALWR